MEFSDQAYVLHTRAYTDSRILIELFARDSGRISAVMRLGTNRAKNRLPQQFTLSQIRFRGTASLKNLTSLENDAPTITLVGRPLFCGLYLNELLSRILPLEDESVQVFDSYEQALRCLQSAHEKPQYESILRSFELSALDAIGYGINFDSDVNGEAIGTSGKVFYELVCGEGFARYSPFDKRTNVTWFSDAIIASIRDRQWQGEGVLLAAKKICRISLNPILGDRPLKSRELFL